MEKVNSRLGDSVLEMTLWNLSTQKVESVNRRLKRSLPPSVNFTRNFSGRAHRAVYTVNHGPGKAVRELCSAIGSPIAAGSSVTKHLLITVDMRDDDHPNTGSEAYNDSWTGLPRASQ